MEVKNMMRKMQIPLLSFSAMSSFLAATGTVIVLNPEDRVSARRGCMLTALGLVFFPSLFLLINTVGLTTAAGLRFRHKYSLSVSDVLDISNKVVSAVQAVLCCVTGAVICSWSCRRDVLRARHYISEGYAWFGAAYFLYDICSMYKVYEQQKLDGKLRPKSSKNGAPLAAGDGSSSPSLLPPTTTTTTTPCGSSNTTFLEYCMYEPMILAHHVFIGAFGFLTIVYLRGDLGDCVFGFAYLMELSTPLVSLRGVLSRLRLKSSPLYIVNGAAMMLVFLLCRVCSMPYVCLMYSRAIGLPYFEAIGTLPLGCKISICILLVPQVYWFCLMSVGAAKVFLGLTPPGHDAGDSKSRRSEKVEKRS